MVNMTQEQAETFLIKFAMVAFPQTRQFIAMNSKVPEQTIAYWAKALLRFEVDECESVIDRWASGALPAPARHEWENFGLVIRSVIINDREIKRRIAPKEPIVRESSYKHVSLSAFIARIIEAGNKFKANEIDEKTCKQLHAEILKEHSLQIAGK
jgi:hypothetical protein